MLNGKAVPDGEIYRARKAGFETMANAVERLNVCFKPIKKNGEGAVMPLSLHRTQVGEFFSSLRKIFPRPSATHFVPPGTKLTHGSQMPSR